MTRQRAAAAAACVLALVVAGAVSGDETVELASGTPGVALTSVQGDRIEEIPVRYLGLQRDALGPGYDLHLIQLEGPLAERVGVAAGMSGSPVFFDGKLIGGLSYRLGVLPTQPVAGVTPIEDMLRPVPGSILSETARPAGSPIATPVQIGGLVREVRAWVAPQLEELGFVVVSGGSAGGGGAGELRPGGPVGVELVRGDLSVAATGTVTAVEGDTVFAFGHPFLGAGPIEMPMVSVEVVHTLADLAGSTKLARVGRPVGAVLEDRLTAIVGRMGRVAPMIDLGLHVHGGSYGDQQFRFEVARNAMLSPLLIALTVANSLYGNTGHTREATLLVSGRVHVAGFPELPVDIAATAVGSDDPVLGVAVHLQQTLAALWGNSFAPVDLERVDLDVTVHPDVRAYRLEAVHYDRGRVRPGQRLRLNCALSRYRGADESRDVELPVPDGLPAGSTLSLVVGSPEYVDRVLGQPLGKRLRSAPDLAAVIQVLAERPARRTLVAAIVLGSPGLVSRGLSYAELPPTAERLLAAGPRRDGGTRSPTAELERATIELDGPIEGGVVIQLPFDSTLEPLGGAALDPLGPGAADR